MREHRWTRSVCPLLPLPQQVATVCSAAACERTALRASRESACGAGRWYCRTPSPGASTAAGRGPVRQHDDALARRAIVQVQPPTRFPQRRVVLDPLRHWVAEPVVGLGPVVEGCPVPGRQRPGVRSSCACPDLLQGGAGVVGVRAVCRVRVVSGAWGVRGRAAFARLR